MLADRLTSNPIDKPRGKRVNQAMTCVDLVLFREWPLRQGPGLEHDHRRSDSSILD